MGLDCVPLGRAKPEHADEWERLMKRLYRGESETETQTDRRNSISILPYESLGAPVVGLDKAADDWICAMHAQSGLSRDEIIANFQGHHAIEMLVGQSDGVSIYSNAGHYDGIDATAFRGAFLEDCRPLAGKLIEQAWTDIMRPHEAAGFGRQLLAASANAGPQPSRPTWLEKQGLPKQQAETPESEQREILSAAGRWYVFWGERGHPIWANY